MIQRCCNCSLVPKIAGKRYHLNSGILFYGLFEYQESAVGAPIIYENNFVRPARYLIEHHADSAQELWQNIFFVVEWNRNRETEPGSHGYLGSLAERHTETVIKRRFNRGTVLIVPHVKFDSSAEIAQQGVSSESSLADATCVRRSLIPSTR